MRINSIKTFSHLQNQNFSGILKLNKTKSYNDNAQETMIEEKHYDYFPFKDESEEEIEKNIEKLGKSDFQEMPYPSWNVLTTKVITVKPCVGITKEQYGSDFVLIDDVRPLSIYG